MASQTITIVSHVTATKAAVAAACRRAMEICGGMAETYAKDRCRVDTGNLRNSITHVVSAAGDKMTLGTAVQYGVYNEFGTGVHAEGGKGRKTPWRYQDSKGVWHKTSGMKPQPFIRPALENHKQEYKRVFMTELRMI